MSWLDLTDEFEEEEETDSKKIPISTTESIESTHEETVSSTLSSTFEKEIAELFDIPKEQIPKTQKSIDLALDLPELNLAPESNTQEAFSFLDYLMDQNKI